MWTRYYATLPLHELSLADLVQNKNEESSIEAGAFVDDKKRARRLVREMDKRILPLCAFVYLLN